MSKKRYVDTSFWSDVWVVDELNALDRYLFLYLLTNEKTNIAGVYQISLRTVSYESGIEKEQILTMLRRMKSRIVYQDGWVVLRNAIKNQNYKNEKIKQGIELALQKCPPSLFLHLQLPNDWIPAVVKKETEFLQIPIDDSSMTPDDSGKLNDSDSDSDIDSSKELVPAKPKVKSKEIDGMFEYWETVVGYAVSSNKTTRKYASALLKEKESQDIAIKIQTVAASSRDRFGPRVADFKDLYYKWDKLSEWAHRNGSQINGKVVKI